MYQSVYWMTVATVSATYIIFTYLFYLCVQLIEHYHNIWKEIMLLDSVHHFDLIILNCDDLKNGLAAATKNLEQILLTRMAADCRNDNETYVYRNYNNLATLTCITETTLRYQQVCNIN